MPKTIQATDRGQFISSTQVPQPGEARVAADIETPVRVLLDNAAFLLAQIASTVQQIAQHTHALATSETPGFMSPADKNKLGTLSANVADHAHALATITTAGFMSSSDKAKLNNIENEAQKVTQGRVREALGALTARRSLPESSFAAGQIKEYAISLPGVTPDDLVISSQYMSNSGQFGVFYHAIDNAVQVFVKNLSSSSKEFTPGEITIMVIKF